MPRPTYTGGRTVYDGAHAITGKRETYTGNKTPTSSTAPSEKKSGGILATLKHIVTQTPKDLADAAIHAPGGIAAIGKATGLDLAQEFAHPTKEHGAHLAPILKAMLESTSETLQHPLRNPGNTLLLGLPAAGSAAGGAARIGAATDAARAGEGAAAVVRAARERPVFEPRVLKRGDAEVKVGSSQSPLGAAGQKVSDKVIQNAAERKPGGLADKLLLRKMGKAVTAEAHTIQDVHKAPAAALIAIGRKLSPAEQKALQVVAEEAPLEGRISSASARVLGATGKKNLKAHQEELDLLHQAKQHLAEVDGKPVFAGEHGAKLNTVLARMRDVASSREELLHSLGALTDEAVQSRKTNAGRVSLGATYEKPTPGKLGLDSPAMKRERARLESLQRRHSEALDADEQFVRNPKDLRGPMSRDQAAARLTDLDKQYKTLVEKVVPEVSPYGGKISQREQLHRNFENSRAGKGNRVGAKRQRTVKAEEFRLAEDKLLATIEKHKGHPAADRAGELVAERARLRDLLNEHAEASIIGEKQPTFPKALEHPNVPPESRPDLNRIVQLGHALEAQQGRVARMESSAASRVKPTGIVGADDFKASPDAIRIPDVARKPGRGAGRPGSVGGQGSIGHLKEPGSTSHEYTGALREHAVRRQDTAQLVGESGMEAAKYAGLRHVHDFVRTAVTDTPHSETDIAVRLDDLKPNDRMPLEVRKFLDDPAEFFKTATPAEAESAFEKVRTRLFINEKTLDSDAAADFAKLKAAGKIGWVPKELLGDLAKPHIPFSNKAVKSVDAVNNASRFAILYLKPAYAIPNLLGNAALTVLQQGFAAVPNLTRAARMNKALGVDLTARIDTLMGEGFARSISAHGQGALHGVVDKAATVWSKGVDTPFRRSSFLYEAQRAGFKTPAELEKLLTDPEHLDTLVDVTQRANRELIDYANLNPTEREVIRRVVFFYPWVKGSTVYAGRLLREHPVKAGALGVLGAEGKRESDEQLGPVPSYLEGVFPVGDRLANPNSAAILQTPAQVGEALAGLAGGDVGQVGELSNFLTPAAALAVAAITHRDRSGYQYKPGESIGGISLDQLVKNLPQYTLGQRVSDAVHGKGQDRLYPPNILDAVLQYTVGGIAPRKYNKQKLAELAANERSRYVP